MTIDRWLPALRAEFPRLTTANCRLTSPVDVDYNCIAWAAESGDRWWWPDPQRQSYWPPGAPREESLDAFVHVFGLLGYTHQGDSTVERGRQQIALFATANGKPTHAARQIPDGWWASKLGRGIDIEHDLTAVEGPLYGMVAVILARSMVVPA